MDALIQQSIRLVTAKQKHEVPWKVDEPYAQPYHDFEDGTWTAHRAESSPSQAVTQRTPSTAVAKLAIYSWNIDFMLPHANSRMNAAVSHLQSLIAQHSSPADTAAVIFLQECVETDLRLLAAHPWVRATFHLTDLDVEFWQSGHYGTATLIDRRLAVEACFRVHYAQTRMERDALFVDVRLGAEASSKLVRLCNTHLESLALEPPMRPAQMATAARFMRSEDVDGAVLAGDLNAIQDFDRSFHLDESLQDAYLEQGGKEEDVAGHTWGQQAATAQRERFGTCRMDKVFFCGGVKLKSFEIFGAGVVVEDQAEQEAITALGIDQAWVTDHLGVKAVFET